MIFNIRVYDPTQDGPAVFSLYKAIFGAAWPLPEEYFHQVVSGHPFYRAGDHIVAEAQGEIIGFAAVQVLRPEPLPERQGGIAILYVAPQWRRQGIGTALHNAALQRLQETGMTVAALGGGGLYRFWPGIPENFQDAKGFFEKMGWENFHPCCDLVRPLVDYAIPASLQQHMAQEGIDLHPAAPAEMPAVLAFEHTEFPFWYREYAYRVALGDCHEILTAWDAHKGLVGTLLMFTPQSKILGVNLLWKELLGPDLGGMGAVGVALSERGRGIGIALVAWASAVLKQRQVGTALIDWTGLVDFYGKAGYQPWRWYHTAYRKV